MRERERERGGGGQADRQQTDRERQRIPRMCAVPADKLFFSIFFFFRKPTPKGPKDHYAIINVSVYPNHTRNLTPPPDSDTLVQRVAVLLSALRPVG